MNAKRRRLRQAQAIALLTILSLLLTGCSFSFWDWLAGRPITRPAEIPVGEETGDEPGGGRRDPVVSTGGDAAPGQGETGEGGGAAPGAGTPSTGDGETGSGDGAGGDGGAVVLPGRCAMWAGGLEPSPGPFEEVTLEPVDEGSQDASFAGFRRSLLEALARRDVEALEAAVAPDIRTGFGEDGGLESFRRQWGLDRDPENSLIWEILTDILNLGGIMTGGSDGPRVFTAPYVYALYSGPLDAFGHAVVTGAGVNIRAEPSTEAWILDQASHLVVRVIRSERELPTVELSGRTYCWVQVQLPSGEIGYVADRFLWSPAGWRAMFQEGDDGWRMTLLVSGD